MRVCGENFGRPPPCRKRRLSHELHLMKRFHDIPIERLHAEKIEFARIEERKKRLEE